MLKYLFVAVFSFVALMAEPLKYPCKLGEWGEFYRKTESTTKPSKPLRMALNYLDKAGYAVDLGVGTGKDTLCLLCKNWRVLAVDQEPEAIRVLSARVPKDQKDRLEVQLSSFVDMKWPDNVDLVVSNSLPFLKPQEFSKVWQDIVGHVAVGGRVAIHFFGNEDVYADRKLYPNLTTHTKEQVLELFKDRFQIESLEDEKVMHPTLDGKGEELWHAIYVVAKKVKN